MRADMSKVIVERPRRPGYDGGGSNRGRSVDPDMMVSKEGMRAPHVRHYGGKELNENLAPLVRFLRSRVGRPWDDVYSEISQHLRVTNAVQQHVRDHLNDYVAVRTQIRDGQIWVSDYGFQPLESSWRAFYVDPRDGVLRENTFRKSYTARQRDRREAERHERATRERSLPGSVELRKAGGIWYQVEIKDIPAPTKQSYIRADGTVTEYEVGGGAYDVITGSRVAYPRYRHEPRTYCASKRQLSSVELRRYGVEND